MNNYKLGNMYSFEPEASLGKQVDECAEHMYIKYGVYPNVAFINPRHMGEAESNYKTKTGKKIRLVPDSKQLLRSFTLAVK